MVSPRRRHGFLEKGFRGVNCGEEKSFVDSISEIAKEAYTKEKNEWGIYSEEWFL